MTNKAGITRLVTEVTSVPEKAEITSNWHDSPMPFDTTLNIDLQEPLAIGVAGIWRHHHVKVANATSYMVY